MPKQPPAEISYKEKFVIRPFSHQDAEAIYKAIGASREHLKRFMSWVHEELSLEQTQALYKDFYEMTLGGEYGMFAAFDKKNGDFLFAISLFPETRHNPLAFEIGYWVSSAHQRRGFGTLAVKIMGVLAFEYYGMTRLSAFVNPENRASLHLIQKCGFKKEGELHNFFGQPTEKMLKGGYSKVRTAHVYSLIDARHQSWFIPVKNSLKIVA